MNVHVGERGLRPVNESATVDRSATGRGADAPATLAEPVVLSVVIPTFNEAQNVREIVRRLDQTLGGIAWEAIFVDDNSPDGTAATVKAVAAEDCRVRCLKRIGRRGLAGACIEGMLASSAPYVAVMDADLQHDETI